MGLSPASIVLTLAQEAALPLPWTGAGCSWRIATDDVKPSLPDSLPPYPLLVSVGERSDGALILLNLEELRAVAITGDHARAHALARHLVAEFLVNPWATPVHVETLGIADELASLSPDFIHVHEPTDIAFVDQINDELDSADSTIDPDEFRATVVATTETEAVSALADRLLGLPGRARGRSSQAARRRAP